MVIPEADPVLIIKEKDLEPPLSPAHRRATHPRHGRRRKFSTFSLYHMQDLPHSFCLRGFLRESRSYCTIVKIVLCLEFHIRFPVLVGLLLLYLLFDLPNQY